MEHFFFSFIFWKNNKSPSLFILLHFFSFQERAKMDHMCVVEMAFFSLLFSLSKDFSSSLFLLAYVFRVSIFCLCPFWLRVEGSGRPKELNGSSCSATSVSCCLAPSSIWERGGLLRFWLLLPRWPLLSDSLQNDRWPPRPLSSRPSRMHTRTRFRVEN